MGPLAWLLIYGGLVVLASLAGGWVPLVVPLTHRRMQLAISFVSGVMLGVALLHLLPHARMLSGAAGHDDPVTLWMLAGFLVLFFIERFFRFHHHDTPEGEPGGHRHAVTWTGAAVGLTVHSLIAGVALAASVSAEGSAAGFATFLAIVLHKPFDSMTIGTLMAAGGRAPASRHLVNIAFGLAVPAGAVVFFVAGAGAGNDGIASAALAFSAGTFLCISLSDLLPELQFHQHDRIKLSAALVAGLAVAWGAARLEANAHALSNEQAAASRGRRLDPQSPMSMLSAGLEVPGSPREPGIFSHG